jgi:hypothetical protein
MFSSWGPHFIVPTGSKGTYSGPVRLRETLDKEILAKELKRLDLPQKVVKVSNPWYYRQKGTETWLKVGESEDEKQNFAVTWDTTQLKNGQYEILGLMHVFVQDGPRQAAIARQGITPVTVEN